jgi:spore coat protein A
LDRRFFLTHSSAAALSLSLLRNKSSAMPGMEEGHAPPLLDLSQLAAFVDPLPIPPVLKPSHSKDGHLNYRVSMREINMRVHRDVPPTRWWSYGDSVPGPTVEARRGAPISVTWANDLPSQHFLPIDTTLCGAEPDKPQVRAVVHVHGAMVPPESDGYPEDWFTPGKSTRYEYPLRQDAASLWYHDHAMGIERLNIYAGLFGAFLIRDEEEDALGLPHGPHEIPIFLFDRLFDQGGQLYYPSAIHQHGKWTSEAFGNAFLVNGKLLPYLDVEPRRYRFRIYNASNARFFRVSMANNYEFQQIGTDQGLLPAPVAMKRLTLAPAERADVVIDFSGMKGETIVVSNDLLPMMQFRVSAKAVTDDSRLPAQLKPLVRIPEQEAVVSRTLTLNEYDNLYGKPMMMLLNGTRWHMPITENPKHGTVEIWQLINMTSDTHPIHLHNTRFQILDRRPFDAGEYLRSGQLRYRGNAVAPGADELGWKDTVRANGRSITRIIARFDGFSGRYVWHCHTLEHAANEMMRPFEIVRS